MSGFPGARAPFDFQALPRIPASLAGTNGITVEKVGGEWTIKPNFDTLSEVSSSDVAASMYLWVKDPNEEFYYKVPVQVLIDGLPEGPPGATPEFSIGTVSTVPYGDPATVTITGTDEAPVLNFEIPAGEDGADGEGTGDVTAAVNLADNALVLGDGGAKGIKTTTSITGIVKTSSGVPSAAVAGTDYLAPAAIGTTVQAYDAELSAIAGLTSAADRFPYFTGSGAADIATLTSVARNLLDDADVATMLATLTARGQGKETIWVPAAAMTARTTNGAASGTAEMSTNKNMVRTLDFDATTQEFAQFEIAMPKSWNNGTVTFQPVWSHASTTTNFGVVWALQAVATSDDDALDVAFGTEQTSTDTGGTTNDRYIGPESSAITIAGTPATGDVVQFQIKRNPSDGSDTMAIDARLHGVKVYYTTSAATDA